ncbi:uncharacterized protein LOC143547842 [Bidens hawaiensis]|uniref:uncharacterized protein LOC143547842 n=1 Tax=Bidens hawaiensis TaxID=980011 RepID=UPI00404A0A30
MLKPLIPSGVELKFINYFDGLVSRTTTDESNKDPLGAYAITEELLFICGRMEWRRRLRFLKSAYLIHTEVRLIQFDIHGNIIPVDTNDKKDVDHKVDTKEMVDSSWLAMRFGVETLFNQKERKQRKGLAFGSMILGCFRTSKSPVLIYELDPMLILQLYHAPPPNVTGRIAVFQNNNHGRFDILVVDLKEFVGDRLCAPVSIMTTLGCLPMMRSVISDDGLLVIHVIPSDYLKYTDVLASVKDVFRKVWKIGIDGDKDFIIVASMDLTFVTQEGGPMSKFVLEEM